MRRAERCAHRRRLLGAAAGLALGATWPWQHATAQGTWPARPVRFVVPFPPGGLTDSIGRLLADAMQATLGQTVVVDNRAGAAGLIGTQAVAEAAPDGYTVLVTAASNHVIAPLTQQAARTDPARDLQPVGLALRTVGVFVVPSDLAPRSLSALIALAKAQPGTLNYASSGVGSANHVQMERFKTLVGVDIVHVPYRGGGPLMTALMAGEVQVALMDYATAEAAVRSGKARALVQTGTQRHVAMPQVPTFSEAGLKDYDPSFWIGLAVPNGTPEPIVARLNDSLNRCLGQTVMKARAQALGWALAGGPPSRMADVVASDTVAYRSVLTNLKLDRQ